ncbi:MAG: hypothetical protein OXI81_09130 [Paracoccaceae bacterium]|nr:hypothetical protein [Paracoccaceae bacterium]MDE2913697.1 hypothetical protein [Paracoccaceae bacterium]
MDTGKGDGSQIESGGPDEVVDSDRDRAERMQLAAGHLDDPSHPLTRLTVAQQRFRLTIGFLLYRQLPTDRPMPSSCRGTVEIGMNHGLINAQEMLAVAPGAGKRKEFKGTDRQWVLGMLERAETRIEYQDQQQADRLASWLEDMTRLVNIIMLPTVTR